MYIQWLTWFSWFSFVSHHGYIDGSRFVCLHVTASITSHDTECNAGVVTTSFTDCSEIPVQCVIQVPAGGLCGRVC